jgi:hypothetical protein
MLPARRREQARLVLALNFCSSAIIFTFPVANQLTNSLTDRPTHSLSHRASLCLEQRHYLSGLYFLFGSDFNLLKKFTFPLPQTTFEHKLLSTSSFLFRDPPPTSSLSSSSKSWLQPLLRRQQLRITQHRLLISLQSPFHQLEVTPMAIRLSPAEMSRSPCSMTQTTSMSSTL